MPQQCVIILFGATGDLAKKKLIPAFATLHAKGLLHKETRIIAVSRREYSDEEYCKELNHGKDKSWPSFLRRITYHQLDFGDIDAYKRLKDRLAQMERDGIDTRNRVFYLATMPQSFPLIIEHLHKLHIANRTPDEGWHRVVFEKPFGHNLASAEELNHEISRIFDERQVYRIDHYLGKELVQNILVLRFTNPIFDRAWDAQHIDHVCARVYEQIGVGTRGEYYDKAGAVRDMVQNHLLQMLALTAMDAPATMDARDIHHEKVKIFRMIHSHTPKEVKENLLLGQYTAGKVNGNLIPDYRKEEGVPKGSSTETFAAVRLFVHSRRWHGVPFYLSTGKALDKAYAEIDITFKEAPCVLFCGPNGKLAPNRLIIRIQPHEGMRLLFNVKEPGSDLSAVPYTMDFSYEAEFGMNTSEAYERLLTDVIRGDQTLFTSWEEVRETWRIIDSLLKARVPLRFYKAGTDGPKEAEEFLPDPG